MKHHIDDNFFMENTAIWRNEVTLLEETSNAVVQQHILTFVYIAVVIFFGIVGNLLSFLYHGFFETRKTVTTFLITTLALNDFLASLIHSDHFVLLRYMFNFTNTLGCQVIYFINHFFVTNSVVLLCPIGVQRFLKVCIRKPEYQMSKRSAMFVICSLTVYSLSVSVRHFWLTGIEEGKLKISSNVTIIGHICAVLHDPGVLSVKRFFNLVDALAFILTNTILGILNGVMAKKVGLVRNKVASYNRGIEADEIHRASATNLSVDGKRNVAHPSNSKINSERKINLMLATVTLSSMLSFLPYFYAAVFINIQPNSQLSSDF